MISALINYIKGYVDFYIEGADIERFLTYCAAEGIEIVSPKKEGYRLFGKVYAKDYKKLKLPARKNGLKLRIIKKHGAIFVARKNKIKIGFIAGIVYIFAFLLVMNMFIWNIEIKGNKNISSDQILNNAHEMGLNIGTPGKSHFVQDIEWYILRENKDAASVEINIQGSKATILVNEKTEESEMVSDDDVPVNIVAKKYGVIRKIDVFDGQDVIKPGDAVMKGDLLVSAVYEDRHNKLTLKHARANIIAETDYQIEAVFPLEQKTYETDKIYKTIYKIRFFGFDFCIGNDKNCSDKPFDIEENDLYFFWIKLPINVIITRYFSVKENNITYSFEQAKDGAFALLDEKEKEELFEAEIISKKIQETVKNGKYIINADYIILMEIGEEQPIESDIPWKNTDDMS